MIDNLIFIVLFGMVIASLAISIKMQSEYKVLKDKLSNSYNTIRNVKMLNEELTKKLIFLEKKTDEMKNDQYVQNTLFASQITEASHTMDILRNDTMKAINAMHDDLLSRIKAERTEESNNVEEDSQKDSECESEPKSGTYRWIFPAIDKKLTDELPIVGNLYLVVGKIKGIDEETAIFTETAVYTRNGFVTDNQQRFNKVYAYIQQPSSSDIWQKVMSLAIEAEERA